jgi:LacI family transcriptional regulator
VAVDAMNRRPTIKDVARTARVSTVTVSRVLNAPGLVQSGTRDRVEAAMRELGYRPNLAARTMRTQTTRSVGILVPDLVNYANAAVAQAAERHLAEAGYCLLLASSDYRIADEAQAIEALRTRQVDGLLLYVSDETHPQIEAVLAGLEMPCVVLDRRLPIKADRVLSDHAQAMRETVRYLAGLGHARLALLGPDLRIRPLRERRRAFEAAVLELGLDPAAQAVVEVPPEDHHRARAPQALLERALPPTAVIAEGSRLVRGVLAAARRRGMAVPEDLSLVGLDAGDIASATTPELTSIVRDYSEIGRTAAELLLDRLRHPDLPPRRVVLESEVVLKGSCAPLRK